MKTGLKVTLVILLVLLLDQWLKFYIKLNFCYGQTESILGLSWAKLRFVENEGMAFGIIFDWKYGKLLLSLFRILMVGGLFWYMRVLIREKAHTGFVYCVGLITAGAIGNIIDSAFYGMIFTESPYHDCIKAQLVPFGQGYGTFLHGKVVDMLYFPIHTFAIPMWSPIWAGMEIEFFSPIFNIADAAISCGVISILLFQRWFFQAVPLGEEIPGGANSRSNGLSSSQQNGADQADSEFGHSAAVASSIADIAEKF